jgi:hypothetical protein
MVKGLKFEPKDPKRDFSDYFHNRNVFDPKKRAALPTKNQISGQVNQENSLK